MLPQKTVKKIAAIIALILVATMVLSMLGGVFTTMAGAANISGLKDKLKSIEAEQKAVKAEISALNAQVEAVSEQKAAIEKEMGLTQDEIETVEDIIDQLDRQIAQTELELEEAILKLEDMQITFEKRIRSMYEQGDTTYLDVVLGSRSFSEMLDRVEIVSRVMDYDKKIIFQYTEAKEEVESFKAQLEEHKTEQEAYMVTLEEKYKELDGQRAEQQKLQDQLEADVALKQRESKKMENEKAAINAEIEELSRQAAAAAAAAKAAAEAAKKKGQTVSSSVTMPYSGSFTWPLSGYGRSSITSPYGWRDLWGSQNFHSGTDIAAPKGTTIKAAAPGTVVKSGMYSSYGNYVVVDHGGGVMTGYAHMSKRSVSVGDKVSSGQKLGEVGSTGNSSGNHLHFQIFINGSTVDPMGYFR